MFAAATVLLALHAADDAFGHPQPGEGAGRHAAAGLLAVAAAVAGVLAYPRLRTGARAALAASFGILGLVNGATHVMHVSLEGVARSDATGLAAAGAGAVLVALAVVGPARRRGAEPDRRRRWTRRAVGTAAAVAGGVYGLFPVAVAVLQTHAAREPVGRPPSAAYAPVAFDATDGVRLSGWYRPSRNGAAVLLVHGGGGDRRGPLRHAAVLARHGYGVLVYDARGRGRSEGSPNAMGWSWPADVEGALRFLGRRADVEPGRVGALGLSTGADALIEVAARRGGLPVIADGATVRSVADARRASGIDASTPFFAVMLGATRILSGTAPGPPLEHLAARVRSPLLLISTGRSVERDANARYAAAQPRAEHWALSDVAHTAGVRARPAEYGARMTRFFGRALARR